MSVSKERRHVEVAFTVNSVDNLPLKDGRQIHADDVEIEIRDVVQDAVTAWYQRCGHELVTYDPLVG